MHHIYIIHNIQEVAENLTKELGAPKVFARKVQAAMFDLHMATTIGPCRAA